MPWYVYALIGYNIFVLSIYFVYAAEGRSVQVTMASFIWALVIVGLEMTALVHLALLAH